MKVNNYEQRVYSPERLLIRLSARDRKAAASSNVSGGRGDGQIPASLDRDYRSIGATAILPYSYPGTEGILNGLNVGDAFFTSWRHH